MILAQRFWPYDSQRLWLRAKVGTFCGIERQNLTKILHFLKMTFLEMTFTQQKVQHLIRAIGSMNIFGQILMRILYMNPCLPSRVLESQHSGRSRVKWYLPPFLRYTGFQIRSSPVRSLQNRRYFETCLFNKSSETIFQYFSWVLLFINTHTSRFMLQDIRVIKIVSQCSKAHCVDL